MENIPRIKLAEMLKVYGHNLSADPQKTRALLLDFCGSYNTEINLLINTQQEKIPGALLTLSSKMPIHELMEKLTQGLQAHCGMTEDEAIWATESWAWALGLIPESALTKVVRQGQLLVASDGSGDFVKVQDAIQAAQPGDIIRVRPGDYSESITINKHLHLTGDGELSKIKLNRVHISADGVVVRGITSLAGITLEGNNGENLRGVVEFCDVMGNVQGAIIVRHGELHVIETKVHDSKRNGVVVSFNGLAIFQNCEIYDCFFGLSFAFGGTAILHNCSIHNVDIACAVSMGNLIIEDTLIYDAKTGLNVEVDPKLTKDEMANFCLAQNCHFKNMSTAINWGNGARGIAANCSMSNVTRSVRILTDNYVWVNGCKINQGDTGVFVNKPGEHVINNCQIEGCKVIGIFVDENGDAIISNSQLVNNDVGILAKNGAKPNVNGCLIQHNIQGGILFADVNTYGKVIDTHLSGHSKVGIQVTDGARAFVEESTIDSNGIGLITEKANGEIKNSAIYKNKGQGIVFAKNSGGLVQNCKIYENEMHGLEIASGSTITARDCQINKNRQLGVYCHANSSGDIQNCDMSDNEFGGIGVDESDSKIAVNNCKNGMIQQIRNGRMV
jgi:hypothetical protein